MYSLSTTTVLCALISSCFAECPSIVTRLEVEDIVATQTITSYAATLQVISGAALSRSTTTIEFVPASTVYNVTDLQQTTHHDDCICDYHNQYW